MGFLDYLSKRRERPSLGVCIPEARKGSARYGAEQKAERTGRLFKISGIYAARGEVSIIGEVVSGSIKLGLKLEGNEEVEVKGISEKAKPVNVLEEGKKGVLQLNTPDDSRIRAGAVLKFK